MTPTEAAHRYADLGWRVIPIRPGQKRPRGDEWQLAATTDHDKIDDWWGRWSDHGVGIVTGAESGIFVVDVDGQAGADSLADLEATYGRLPDTVETVTGSGGRHLYFRWPTGGTEIRNDQAGRLGVGLDIRGEGGQVLAAPTIHPNGTAYEWEASSDPLEGAEVAAAPEWLVELLSRPSESQPDRERKPARDLDENLPGHRFAAAVTWPELLEADGATFLGRRIERDTREPYELWSRPPMHNEAGFEPHTSASLYYKGSDVLKVFTSNWCFVNEDTGEITRLDQDATYTKLGYLAARSFGGDISAAAGWCAAHYPTDDDDWLDAASMVAELPVVAPDEVEDDEASHGWEFVDLAPVVAHGYQPPVPDVLERHDGSFLFYRGRINALWGESGSGKTWVMLLAFAQALRAGRHCLMIDLEDHEASICARLMALGVDAATIASHFHYIAPQMPYGQKAQEYLREMCRLYDFAVIGIDSTGEAMALNALGQNNDDEVAQWYRRLPRFVASLGPAVILVDHVPKDKEARGLNAIGSQRKKAAIDGAAFMVEVRVAPTKTEEGKLRLIVAKDRNGHWQMNHTAAEVTITPEGDEVGIQVMPVGPVDRPTNLMQKVSEYLEAQDGPVAGRTIEKDVEGKTEYVRKAVKVLSNDGYIVREGRGWVVQTAYREDMEWIDIPPSDEAPRPRAPTAPLPRPDTGEMPPEASAPPRPCVTVSTQGRGAKAASHDDQEHPEARPASHMRDLFHIPAMPTEDF